MKENNEYFTLDDFFPSDGIFECEQTIIDGGGKIEHFYISFPPNVFLTKEVEKAIDYLIDEWDYGLQ